MSSWANLYRVEETLMQAFIDNPQNLDAIVYGNYNDNGKLLSELGLSKDWTPDKYSLDRWEKWERYVLILGECASESFYELFNDCARNIDYDGCNVQYYSPQIAQEIARQLTGVSSNDLQKKGLEKALSTYDSRVFTAFDYKYAIGDVENIQQFFQTAAAKSEYVLLVAGGF